MLIDSGLFMEISGERTLEHISKGAVVRLAFDPFDDVVGVEVIAPPAAVPGSADLQTIEDAVSDARDAASTAENAADDARRACDRVEKIADRLRGDA